MTNQLIYDLWKDFVEYGHQVRITNQDGLLRWNQLKEIYKWLDNSCLPQIIDMTHSSIRKIIQDHITYSPQDATHTKVFVEIDHNGQILDNSVDCDHFYIQHFRIPIMLDFRIPLIKLLQIAYNVGQLSACFGHYTSEQLEFYQKYNLNQFFNYT